MLFLFPSLPQQLIQKLLGQIKRAYSILSELTCTFNKKINERGLYWDKENNEVSLTE